MAAESKHDKETFSSLETGSKSGTEEYDQPETIWLCQYRRSEMPDFEQDAETGFIQDWRINGESFETVQKHMHPGDRVVYWRTVDKVKGDRAKKSRGGIVGWGRAVRGVFNLSLIHI